MLETVLEGMTARLTGLHGDLDAAREEFHARTGAFEHGDPWYEERIRAFFDWYLCAWSAERLPEDALGLALRRASRGLYRVLAAEGEEASIAEDLGAIRVRLARAGAAQRLRVGDRFDGRLVVYEGRIQLAPGIIFHPAETHEALDELLAEARDSALGRDEILDGLLRMRMRLDRFTSIRARHVYRIESLSDTEILSAAWARRPPSVTP